ncbi:MAG: hypothetical protein LBS25_09270 [Candidatus Symbiothrix sp.]|jgi:septal ring factor EnvC (AmiA/AmiB activator)|nr:hypothetical protein [Candidatus Symbiothrix sp.]
MKKILFISALCAIFCTSCVKNSSEYKQLQAQRDSLALADAQSKAELNDILSLLNEVEDNFREIKAKENYLSVQSSTTGELTPSNRERVESDLQFITETLDSNRKKIADLEVRMKKANIKSTQLSKTLENLRQELSEKTNAIVALQEELAKRDQKIAEMGVSLNILANDVDLLAQQSKERKEIIQAQQAELNKVFYCFGTSKELKDNKIIVKGALNADFDPAYFIPTDNSIQNIPLLAAKKGALISKHPAGSYEFGNDAKGKLELRILDAKSFWSLTKFLVIEVKM